MKFLMVLIMSLLANLSQAIAAQLPASISCTQFGYWSRLGIELDLENRSYKVILREPRNNPGHTDALIGEGTIGSTISQEGIYLVIALLENNKHVGTLKAVNTHGTAIEASPLLYKGVNYEEGGSRGLNTDPLFCDWNSS